MLKLINFLPGLIVVPVFICTFVAEIEDVMSILDELDNSIVDVKETLVPSEMQYQYCVNVGGIHYITLSDEEILDFYNTTLEMFPAVTEFCVTIKHSTNSKWEEYDKKKTLWTIIHFNAQFSTVVQLSRFLGYLFSSIERFKVRSTYSLQLVLRKDTDHHYSEEFRAYTIDKDIIKLVRKFPELIVQSIDDNISLYKFKYGVRKMKY